MSRTPALATTGGEEPTARIRRLAKLTGTDPAFALGFGQLSAIYAALCAEILTCVWIANSTARRSWRRLASEQSLWAALPRRAEVKVSRMASNADAESIGDIRAAHSLFPATDKAAYFNTAAVGLASRTLLAAYRTYLDQLTEIGLDYVRGRPPAKARGLRWPP